MTEFQPPDLLERVVYRDADVLIVDKPVGLISAGPAVQIRGERRESVESLLVAALKRPLWAVHQLDRMTSGLNVFALKASRVQPWAERLKQPHTKRYLAICHGLPHAPQRVDVPLGMRVEPGTQKTFPTVDLVSGKPSLTLLLRAQGHQKAAWVEVELASGRQHQVRLHLAHIGHRLFGEPLHGGAPCTRHERHALHAHHLSLAPFEGRPALEVRAPIPSDLKRLAGSLGLANEPWT